MLSKTVEYALRAAAHLAAAAPEACTTDVLSERTQVPRAYLSKVVQALRRAGLVVSRRGGGGGIALARDPKEITLLDVVDAVEPIQRIESCPLKLVVHAGGLCPLHRKVDAALADIREAFASMTLAALLTESVSPLCRR